MRSKATRIAIACIVSGALLAVVFWQIDLQEAAVRFRGARPGWLVVAAAASLLVLLVRGARFAILNRAAAWPLTTAATAIQVFLNRVTPLRLGELSLPWLLRRHAGEDAARSLVTVIFVRLIDLVIVVAAVVMAIGLRRTGEGAPPLLPSLAALVALGALLAGFRPVLRISIDGANEIVRLLRLHRFRAIGGGMAKLRAAAQGGQALGRGALAGLIASSFAVFAGQLVLFFALLAAFSVEIGPIELIQGGAVAQAGAAVPIAAFGSFGTQEAAWVAGFGWVGVPMQDALVTAVACQFVTLAFAALFALPAWLWLARQPHARTAAAPPSAG